jgi:acetyl-CoA/propionyl-CoA carboxylase biotin carboxyl carrier protein
MKMENPIPAHKAGVVTSIKVEVGGSVTAGAPVAEITDAPTAG